MTFNQQSINENSLKPTKYAYTDYFTQKALTQSGCRELQKKMLKDKSFCNLTLYYHLKPNMLQIIDDKFGNYLYQFMIDFLNSKNFNHFLNFIEDNFQSISYSLHGTRVIQKLIERIIKLDDNSNKIFQMVCKCIKGSVRQMCLHENARHVIQKFIEFSRYFENNFIYQEILCYFLEIAKSKYGCCVIGNCLRFGNIFQKSKFVGIALQNVKGLISEEFGNYVLQSLIFNSDDKILLAFYNIIEENIIYYCKGKHSSKVIEKLFCLKKKYLLNRFGITIAQSESSIYQLIFSEYGNYIIQKILLSPVDEKIKVAILRVINKNAHSIAKISYGKAFLMRIKKNLSLFSMYVKCF